METLDGGFFDAPVHSLNLSVSPGMLDLGEVMFNAMLSADMFKNMITSVTITGTVRELDAVIGEHRMKGVWHCLEQIAQELCSPQSNGMAESFVNTFKRDYVARMDLHDAQTVLAQLPAAFEHFNEVHPHSSLKMRSPREFRRQQAAGADQALYCE